MKILYSGTAAAEGVPAMFCSCPICKNLRENYKGYVRTRSQIIIDDVLSVDFPPEAFSHSLSQAIDLSSLRYALITHSHMDHFYAHDFILRGYKYASLECDVLEIYGNAEVSKVFSECTAREMKSEVRTHVRMNTIGAFKELKIGDFRVVTIPALHGTREEALLYYIERGGKGYLHLYDTGEISSEAIAFLAEKGAKADVVSFDCTFLDAPPVVGTRHMCIVTVAGIRERMLAAGVMSGGTRSVITHFSHNANPTPERLAAIEKEYSVTAAYDGMVIDI